MKTEADVINKILEMAKTDPSIRAAIRTNMLCFISNLRTADDLT